MRSITRVSFLFILAVALCWCGSNTRRVLSADKCPNNGAANIDCPNNPSTKHTACLLVPPKTPLSCTTCVLSVPFNWGCTESGKNPDNYCKPLREVRDNHPADLPADCGDRFRAR